MRIQILYGVEIHHDESVLNVPCFNPSYFPFGPIHD